MAVACWGDGRISGAGSKVGVSRMRIAIDTREDRYEVPWASSVVHTGGTGCRARWRSRPRHPRPGGPRRRPPSWPRCPAQPGRRFRSRRSGVPPARRPLSRYACPGPTGVIAEAVRVGGRSQHGTPANSLRRSVPGRRRKGCRWVPWADARHGHLRLPGRAQPLRCFAPHQPWRSAEWGVGRDAWRGFTVAVKQVYGAGMEQK